MSDVADLSDLARLFLRHREHIRAGEDALRADIPPLLAGLAKRADPEGQFGVRFDAAGVKRTRGVKRTWTVGTLNLPVVLRLSWAPDALPEFSLTSRPPEELVGVFPDDMMPVRGWPTTTAAVLSAGPARELWRLWEKAVDVVEGFIKAGEIARRSAAVAVMQEVSRRLSAKMQEADFPKTKFTKGAAKTLKQGKMGNTWPCFVQWQLGPDQSGHRIYCDLSYWPSGPGPEGSKPVLALVFHQGEPILPILRELDESVGHFPGKGPVVLDWSDELLDFKGDAAAISKLAEKIVKESMDRYADVLKKMGLLK